MCQLEEPWASEGYGSRQGTHSRLPSQQSLPTPLTLVLAIEHSSPPAPCGHILCRPLAQLWFPLLSCSELAGPELPLYEVPHS